MYQDHGISNVLFIGFVELLFPLLFFFFKKKKEKEKEKSAISSHVLCRWREFQAKQEICRCIC
jgi:hypothetical protein